jgi:hypothetical protein
MSRWFRGALVFVCLFPAIAAAQDTRAAVLEQERAEKAKQLAPYDESRLEKFIKEVEDGKYKRMFYPHNGFYLEYGYSEKPVGAGVGMGGGWRHDLFNRQARVVLEGGITFFRNYQFVRADFSLPRLFDEHLELGVAWKYRRHTQDDFFGIGNDSLEDNRTTYLYKAREIEGRAVLMPLPWLRAGTRTRFINPEIGSGTDSRFPSTEEIFSPQQAPGLVEQPNYLYADAFAEVDYRDEEDNARSGGYYHFALGKYSDRDFDSFSFRNAELLLQQFIPIFDKKRVFALQARIEATSADDGHEVPFYYQPVLGGGHSLRSVNDYRFRDRHIIQFNAEYRWEAFGLLDMALFTDWGKVAPRFEDLDFSDMTPAYGIGFRFNTASAVFFRFDIATGAGEGLHYFFKFSKMF